MAAKIDPWQPYLSPYLNAIEEDRKEEKAKQKAKEQQDELMANLAHFATDAPSTASASTAGPGSVTLGNAPGGPVGYPEAAAAREAGYGRDFSAGN